MRWILLVIVSSFCGLGGFIIGLFYAEPRPLSQVTQILTTPFADKTILAVCFIDQSSNLASELTRVGIAAHNDLPITIDDQNMIAVIAGGSLRIIKFTTYKYQLGSYGCFAKSSNNQ